ncbi:MAG: hypothetical protein IVW51_13545 [Thermaceae bacterium]|nr:hypothetical protein [Thermaceae bacterium]
MPAQPEPRPSEPPDQLEALRRLLLKPEQERLERLDTPQEWVEQVAQALPEALIRRANEDRAVQQALARVLEESFTLLVQRNPKLLAEILFPVILPAIRRAVAQMFASLVQNFNQTLDQAVSPQGLRWRLEALTTGKPFGEVVLSHTLLYRVEQVFLIQRESGLLLARVVAAGVSVQDGAMVSGMLTAIGDFVRDSFDPSADLNTVNFGERVLVAEGDERAVLAAVVRGTPPTALKERLQDVRSEIELRFAEVIRHYQGDSQPLEPTRPLLESLLEAQYQTPARRPPYALWVVGVLVLLGLGGWGWNIYQATRNWNTYLERLHNTPGIVLTGVPGRYKVQGLRDPLAADPLQLAKGLNLPHLQTRFQPYQSLEPEIVLRRIKARLGPNTSFKLDLNGNILSVSGPVTQEWLVRLQALAPTLGISNLEIRIQP